MPPSSRLSNLKQLQGLKWISRVPLTLTEAQEVSRQVVPLAEWKGLANGHRLIEVCTTYAEVAQRWVIVESEKRREADLKQLQKQVNQEQQRQQRQLDKLAQESFACEADALKAAKKFEQTLRYCRLSPVVVVEQAHYDKRGRPKHSRPPQSYSYHLQATLVPHPEAMEERQRIAGRFILATNELECEALDAVEVLAEYKKQQSSERGFRFLKDPLFFTKECLPQVPPAHHGIGNGDGIVFTGLYAGSTPAAASLKRGENGNPESTG